MSIKFEDIKNKYKCFGINSDSVNKERALMNESSSQEIDFYQNLDHDDIQIKIIETPSNFLSKRTSLAFSDLKR